MSHHRLMRGGAHVGVLCDYEPDGDETDRDLRRAAASVYAARRSAEQLRPPRTPDGYPYSGSSDLIDSEGAVTSFTPSLPIYLTRGGAAVAVTVGGVNFVSTDSFTYGNAGITNNSAPVLASSSEWDLSVKASGGMPAGDYSLKFVPAGSTDISDLWQGVFRVV